MTSAWLRAWWRNQWPSALILVVLVLGAALRLHGIDFGFPALNDPDELMFEMGATRMLTGPTLNPGWFGHPATISMYVLAVVNAATFAVGWLLGYFPDVASFLKAIYHNPGIVMIPGRIAMAAFGTFAIWQTWKIARSIGGLLAGTIAALLMACSTLTIQYSQLIRSDMIGTVFILMVIAAALRIARSGLAKDYRWAALGVALAVACKWPFGTVAIAVVGAAAARIASVPDERDVQLARLRSFIVLAPIFLVIVSPYLVLDYPTVLRNLGGEAQVKHLGATSEGLFANMAWYLKGPLLDGMGLPGLVLCAIGLIRMIRVSVTGWVILPVLLVYGVMICFHGLRWERWVLPMLPLLAIAAGLAAAELTRAVRDRWPGQSHRWLAAVVILATSASLIGPAWNDAEARTHDTRQAATQWARQNIPAGSKVMIEHFAFDLIDAPWTILFPMGDAGCVDAKSLINGRVNYSVIDKARGSRSNVDYGTVAPSKRDSCRSDYVILMEMERYRAERVLFPDEYHAYESLLADMKVRTIIHPEPGRYAGPTMVIMERKRPGG